MAPATIPPELKATMLKTIAGLTYKQAREILESVTEDLDKAHKTETIAPDPVPPEYVRQLCVKVGGQCQAARLLRIDSRTVRRWIAGETSCHWHVAELLRRLTVETEKKGTIP